MQEIAVGLSGGVDSAVSAYLLQQQGYKVTGIFMQNWEDDTPGVCSVQEDLASAQAVAKHLGIRLEKINTSANYWEDVFQRFLDEYAAGRTPNPDIWCNQMIKFPLLLDYAAKLGIELLATGHYANILEDNQQFYLQRCLDSNKDQSYFLYRLSAAELARCKFPLAQISKPQVREIAAKINLPNHSRPDSVGVCFIGPKRFRNFLQEYLLAQPGAIKHLADDKVIGQHQGLAYYTRGQRSGLNIGGVKGASEEPWYVASKDLENNVLYACQGRMHPALWSQQLSCNDLHWINSAPAKTELSAQIRHRQPPQACTIAFSDNDTLQVQFAQPVWASAAGQSIVFYDNDICIGGGIIANS
jgi:tRNA-uridine 2-sulfurtransferase